MSSEPNDPHSLAWSTALDVHNQPSTISDGEIFIEVPLLIGTPVGAKRDEGARLLALGDVQHKTETGHMTYRLVTILYQWVFLASQ
jgi:hypothetical protein